LPSRPIGGGGAGRCTVVAWDLGAAPPMWPSVDPARRVKRAQKKLEQAEQRKKRRVAPTPMAPTVRWSPY
jgi:hypothetical protein